MSYPKNAQPGVAASPDLPEVERRVLDYWQSDKTFEASVENRPAGENGLLHAADALPGKSREVLVGPPAPHERRQSCRVRPRAGRQRCRGRLLPIPRGFLPPSGLTRQAALMRCRLYWTRPRARH